MLFLIPFIEFKETFSSYSLQDESQSSFPDDNSQSASEQNVENAEKEIDQDADHTENVIRASENTPKSTFTTRPIPTQTKLPPHKKNASKIYDDQLMDIITKADDPDEQFMLSCMPLLKILSPRNNIVASIEIQKLLFNLEFGNTSGSRPSSVMSSAPSTSTDPQPFYFSPTHGDNDNSSNYNVEQQYSDRNTNYNFIVLKYIAQ